MAMSASGVALTSEFLQRPGIAQGLEHIDLEGRDGRAPHAAR